MTTHFDDPISDAFVAADTRARAEIEARRAAKPSDTTVRFVEAFANAVADIVRGAVGDNHGLTVTDDAPKRFLDLFEVRVIDGVEYAQVILRRGKYHGVIALTTDIPIVDLDEVLVGEINMLAGAFDEREAYEEAKKSNPALLLAVIDAPCPLVHGTEFVVTAVDHDAAMFTCSSGITHKGHDLFLYEPPIRHDDEIEHGGES